MEPFNFNELPEVEVSVAALYTKVSRQEIPVSKPGKRLYFNRTDLKEWIRQGKRKTLNEIRQNAKIQSYQSRLRPALKKYH
jgi:hypothetical protein